MVLDLEFVMMMVGNVLLLIIDGIQMHICSTDMFIGFPERYSSVRENRFPNTQTTQL